MTRAATIQALTQDRVFDLAIVGGGATGLGVALDAALRGFSVVLLESHDFAGGTSSRSTKLLHGGVRYLAPGNVALVRLPLIPILRRRRPTLCCTRLSPDHIYFNLSLLVI